MNGVVMYEIVVRHGGHDTPLSLAPLFDSLAKANAWIATYKAANPDVSKNGADVVARLAPPGRKFS
jgi:hypothetical protein